MVSIIKSTPPMSIIFWILIIFLMYNQYPRVKNAFLLQGNLLPSFQLQTLNGERKSWTPDNSTPIILIFWATWCSPCKVEMSRYNDAIINKEIPANAVYAINIGEELLTINNTLKERNYQFEVYIDSDGELNRHFKVAATPTVVHIDKDGIVNWVGLGISPTSIFRAKKLFK